MASISSSTLLASAPSSKRINSVLPRITAVGLLISWAIPAVSSPSAASFSCTTNLLRVWLSKAMWCSSCAVFSCKLAVRDCTFASNSCAACTISSFRCCN
ncbi:Uncharacterised protein [Vibrio cholerae]|nr:Uncharacterised protein [Vibrio cholerae]